MGKFFNGQVKNNRTKIIRYIIIGIGVVLIIFLFALIAAKSRNQVQGEFKLKEDITIDVSSKLPSKTELFDSLDNIDIDSISVDYSKVNVEKVGEYEAVINIPGKKAQEVKIIVVDTTAPVLTLNDIEIDKGEIYSINDFVLSCEDNYDEECIIEYYSTNQDQEGNKIDYSAYTNEGNYLIKIIAKDSSGNESPVKEAKLTIGNGNNNQQSVNCIYGDLTVNASQTKYPIAVIVGDENAGCALNRDLYDDKEIQKTIDKVMQDDIKKLKTELEPILDQKYPRTSAHIVTYPNYISIFNENIEGLIGYALHIKVYIVAKDYTGKIETEENLALSYYVKSDLTREYLVNKYNLN